VCCTFSSGFKNSCTADNWLHRTTYTAAELHSNLHSCTMHIRASNYCCVLYLQFRVQEQLHSRQLAAPYHLHSCRAAQQSAQLHDAHSNFKSLLCAVPSVEGSKKAAISLLTYAQQTTGCTVPPNYHQQIVICKMSLAHAKPLHVSITATTNGCRKCLCCHQSLPSMQWAVALHRVA